MTVITTAYPIGIVNAQNRPLSKAVRVTSAGGQVFLYPRFYPVIIAAEALLLRRKSFCVRDVSLELKIGKRRGWVDAFILKTLLFIWGLGYLDYAQQITEQKHLVHVFAANRYTPEFFQRFKNKMYDLGKKKPVAEERKEDTEDLDALF